MNEKRSLTLRYAVVTAMLAAASAVLMFFSFSVPLMPSYIKMDFSDLPALIAAFTMGPHYGVIVCALKNLINLPFSTTVGIGELSNFILSAAFVLPAGFIYRKISNYKGAAMGSIVGAVSMGVLSFFSNLLIIYPLYAKVLVPMNVLMKAYTSILPFADQLWIALLIFNLPFTIVKGLLCAILAIVLYKPLRPLIQGSSF